MDRDEQRCREYKHVREYTLLVQYRNRGLCTSSFMCPNKHSSLNHFCHECQRSEINAGPSDATASPTILPMLYASQCPYGQPTGRKTPDAIATSTIIPTPRFIPPLHRHHAERPAHTSHPRLGLLPPRPLHRHRRLEAQTCRITAAFDQTRTFFLRARHRCFEWGWQLHLADSHFLVRNECVVWFVGFASVLFPC